MLRPLLVACLLPIVAPAQRPSPEEAVREKLASPFLRHADWTTDYERALRLAADEKKLILGYFTTAYY